MDTLAHTYRRGMCAGELQFETSERQQRPVSAPVRESSIVVCLISLAVETVSVCSAKFP